ncbi:DUF3857 domain-containing protein [Niabella sp. CJ426]|uniref:DUF3857 domain-containing protein n=1 Tax=Niabella sp. CJ426 TaxID=3393740 RepID=UPI003CFCCEEB
MKKILALLTIISLVYNSQAQYAVKDIPEALTLNAHLVKRLDNIRVDIKNPGKAYYYRHYVYTIMNEAAERYAYFVDYYDKFRDINSISGTLYDASGNKIKNVKKKDIADESGTSGNNLADDARYKVHNFYHKNYPYTVEYEVEGEMKGIFNLPEWQPVSAPEIAVEKSSLTVITPKDYTLRYKQLLYSGNVLIKEEKSDKIYQWQLNNEAAKPTEAYAPEWDNISTRVIIAPSQFEFGGYNGEMSNWQNFGKFMLSLYSGRDVLPADIKAKVHQLTDHLKTNQEKIATLYRFMQDNTHYISIQLGIGGWQPLDATYVAKNKYGDCKALSNYMVALLKEAGIKANNVLIKAGEDETAILSDFPSNQFNHVVVCVPAGKDTTWLECTSQTVAPGYMGSFTGNREALLVSENGSAIVRTPAYRKENNLQVRQVKASIDANGKLTAKVSTTSTGLQQDDLHSLINSSSPDEQKKRLQRIFTLSNYEVPAFSYLENREAAVPTVNETLELVANDYASITGKRLFLRPNIVSTYTSKLAETEKRTHDIVCTYAFVDRDTVNITIPEGYQIESMPPPVKLNNQFGAYHVSYKIEGRSILLIRSYERNAGTFPAKDYTSFVDFYNKIYKADQARMVFVKKEE